MVNLTKILNQTFQGILATDRDGVVSFANKRARELLSTHTDEIVGRPLPSDFSDLCSLVTKTARTGTAVYGKQIHTNGLDLMVTLEPVAEKGTRGGVLCTFVALKDFEKAAMNLESYQELGNKFRTVFDYSSDGLWICNRNGEVVEVNRATRSIVGRNKKDLIGRKVRDLVVTEGYYDNYVTDEVIRTKRKVSQLQEVKTTKRKVLCTGIPVLDKNGEVAMVVINERDITMLYAMRERLEEIQREKETFKEKINELSLEVLKNWDLVAESEEMKKIVRTALKLAHMDASNIMILGESGTGKGLLAKFIHKNSKRADKPFIQINCASLPENILEAELFGYEKGAFTGAKMEGKPGLIELSNQGTLFLDEIGEMSSGIQAKLLKYLDDHEVRRLGSVRTRKIDCKILAATNQDLETLLDRKKFRKDLYYRLNAITLTMPPLRERPEDIFHLVQDSLFHYNKKYKMKKTINPLTLTILQSYDFPGNVRELKNLVKKGFFMSEGDAIDRVLIDSVGDKTLYSLDMPQSGREDVNGLTDLVAAFEKGLLKIAARKCNSTREIARYFNISQPSVVRKLRKYHLKIS